MGSHRRPAGSGSHRGHRGTTVTVLSAASATAAAALAAAPAGAAPPDEPADARAEVGRLYQEAERATEAYNEASERTDRLRRAVLAAEDGIARGQQRINGMRNALGSLAGAQYRSGGIDPAVELLLATDPDDYLDKVSVLDRLGTRQAARLTALRSAQRGLAQDRAETRRKLTELERSRKAVARHKRTVEHKLAAARRLLHSLPDDQRGIFGRASRDGRDDFFATGPAASSRAAVAVAAARSAIGRPYVWGASGPSAFDCSGLMQWAYAQAGVSLPRTSGAQRYAGHRVPLSQARPGDLVAYRHDASHIAMYIGHGRVVHAPHPGATVRTDPVAMLPVSSVTRV